MSDNFNRTTFALQPFGCDEDPFNWDWSAFKQEVDEPIGMSSTAGLFHDITLESLAEEPSIPGWWNITEDAPHSSLARGLDQSHEAELQPDRTGNYVILELSATTMTANTEAAFACDFQGCSKHFVTRGNLVRHQKSHAVSREYRCPARECNYSFTRADKLRDHIWTGHDQETIFACTAPDCQSLLTRDLLPLHGFTGQTLGNVFRPLRCYRQCPMPRCGLRFYIKDLDTLQQHLLECHSSKGRKQFAALLADSGYDHDTADIMCPVCHGISLFKTHEDFRNHVLENHCGSKVFIAQWGSAPADIWTPLKLYMERSGYGPAPAELREHRRTILSLDWGFDDHPVWRDVEQCPSRIADSPVTDRGDTEQ